MLERKHARLARAEVARSWDSLAPIPSDALVYFLPANVAAAQTNMRREITSMAERHSVELSGAAFAPPDAGTDSRHVRLEVSASGNHDDVVLFIADVERSNMLLRIQRMRLEPAATAAGALTAELTFVGVRGIGL
ncbi:MAG: hypothetical protein HC774_03605 [Sphingomonadales bacterium]|nr:hypothetical protein [Sphingomonadales bacterium]